MPEKSNLLGSELTFGPFCVIGIGSLITITRISVSALYELVTHTWIMA